MSNHGFGTAGGERIEGPRDVTSETRYSAVTDSLNTNFGLLRDPHRRYLLYYLFAVDENVVELEAAVNAVCKFKAAGTEADHSSRKEVRSGLHHNHLPRLMDAGVIEYDYQYGTIGFTGDPALEEWIEHAQYKELE